MRSTRSQRTRPRGCRRAIIRSNYRDAILLEYFISSTVHGGLADTACVPQSLAT
ncbi:MAG: hypothetical protein ACLVIZ_00730 [Bifidobacterium pseudocatenulatum]